jgi:hypothetical protein
MSAIGGISPEHRALLDEYEMALRLWSEARVLYAPGAEEVLEATKHVENLEKDLALYKEPALAA